jgi:hypothetical protein
MAALLWKGYPSPGSELMEIFLLNTYLLYFDSIKEILFLTAHIPLNVCYTYW